MQNKPAFREFSDINFLRGFAVLAVVIFHISKQLMPLGFLGVDVFFVISGYLITWSINRKFKAEDYNFKRTIKNFYKSRVKKIFPSLAVLIWMTGLFGLLVLTNEEIYIFVKQCFYALIFVPNLYFSVSLDYFSQTAEKTLLLHTWSLGIEEQFYIVWPFLFLTLLGFRKHRLISFGLIVASLLAFMLVKSDTEAFYNPLLRAWELLAGSWVFMIKDHLSPKQTSLRYYLKIFIFICLLVIVAFTKKDPRWINLSVVILSGAFMYLCDGPMGIPFVSRFMEFFGRRSYSVYLFHWPPLAFLHILWFEPSIKRSLLAATIGTLVGIINFKYVEELFYRNLPTRASLYLWLGSFGFLAVLYSGVVEYRYPNFANEYNARAWTTIDDSKVDNCDSGEFKSEFCRSVGGSPEFMLIGDSHAGQMINGFIKYSQVSGKSFQVVSAGSCHPVLGFEQREGCLDFSRLAIERIAKYQESLKSIWITGYAGDMRDEKNLKVYTEAYKKFIAEISKFNITIYLVEDTPLFTYSFKQCEPEMLALRTRLSNHVQCPEQLATEDLRDMKFYRSFVKTILDSNPNVKFLETRKYFCNQASCETIDEQGRILFGDDNHLSKYGSAFLIEKVMAEVAD